MKARVKDSSIPYVFVQCASCGSVVGVSEAPYILKVLSQIAGKFGIKLRT